MTDEDQVQLGESFFKSYYVSIDVEERKMYYSPLNRFPAQNYGVYVLRALICFALFLTVATMGAMIWQIFNDPYRKNQRMFRFGGVRLVEYERAN